MEIFNVGPLELLLILVLAVIIFGPEDLVKFSRNAGRWIYKASKSEFWQSVVGTTREIKDFPKQIMKEAQIEETLKEFNSLNQSIKPGSPVTSDPPANSPLPAPQASADPAPENKDEPPTGE